ncbi:MAG: ROK family protein [Planctomycetales bacterium]|nr:ROK family protein [Planctomycetales bacterium]NIM08723.1 ROK family protein [Planctomycetales bacterium]NIN08193.1 ROK family protein [Planctomycetales bacterium]NIN77321.1 ROK family protein [Planctomycetales bacterium]NIO34505.1 ROK family protein [Planctomycetales bacterium]
MVEKEKAKYWVGFDLGGTKMLAKIYDQDFKAVGSERTKTRGHEGAKAGLERIERTIRKALESAKIDSSQLAGIGVGCPGPLDLKRGVILDAPNLGWENVPVRKTLTTAFGCPAHIANDVDVGVYGEHRFGAAKGARTSIGIFPGTGIGGGCVYEGKIIRGRTSSCMEIGHIQVMPEGPRCGCGRRGCLEAVASRLAISARSAMAAYRGKAPHLLKQSGTDLANIRSGALAASIKAGDEVVEIIVREAARHIGRAAASLVNLMAPDVLVLGGGLVEAMPELFVSEVKLTAERRVLSSFVDSFKVVAAKLGDDAGVLGAAAWAHQQEQEEE